MKNMEIFPRLGKVRGYQLKCAFLLTSVPVICAAALAGLLSFFAQMNLYFLEYSGLPVAEEIRSAYEMQVQLALLEISWYLVALFFLTFVVSFLLMGWAVSPFINAEALLRDQLKNRNQKTEESDWLSESPYFHKMIWGLAQQLTDGKFPLEKAEPARYRFNYRFFGKFVFSFAAVSLAISYVVGIVMSTAYVKIVSLAINLTPMKQKSHYYISQEDLLRLGQNWMLVLSCVIYAIMGFYITRYMSNMLFVFSRAVKEKHFPLKLRDSDIYHELADAISQVADTAGISNKR